MKKPICKYAKIAPRMKNPCNGFIPVYARDDMDKYLEDLQASHYTENVDQGMANKKLQEEIAELKAHMPKYQQFIKDDEFKKKLIDEYNGYVYDWKGHNYIATPYINIFIKGILYALWMSRAANAKHLVTVFENYDYLGFYKLNIKQESARTWMTCKCLTPEEWIKIWKNVQAKCEAYAKRYSTEKA